MQSTTSTALHVLHACFANLVLISHGEKIIASIQNTTLIKVMCFYTKFSQPSSHGGGGGGTGGLPYKKGRDARRLA